MSLLVEVLHQAMHAGWSSGSSSQEAKSLQTITVAPKKHKVTAHNAHNQWSHTGATHKFLIVGRTCCVENLDSVILEHQAAGFVKLQPAAIPSLKSAAIALCTAVLCDLLECNSYNCKY